MTFIDRSFGNGDREVAAITPPGTALWLHLRHDRQRATFRVREEGHPFFRAIGMTMNHVWSCNYSRVFGVELPG
jgi:hypothetical protein